MQMLGHVASYHPRPTIIEAARALYAHHSVEAIDQFDAGEQNLAITSRRVEELVDDARAKSLKRICFVTGVPGAGKTLVGLNLATRREENQPTHAVFLSGNGPLVEVLQAALTRDELARHKKRGDKVRKGEVEGPIKSFIQNVHHFRDEGIIDPGPPDDHVVIFDEAQRAWNQKKAADFMLRRKKRAGFLNVGARVLNLIHGSTPRLGRYHLPRWWRSGDSHWRSWYRCLARCGEFAFS